MPGDGDFHKHKITISSTKGTHTDSNYEYICIVNKDYPILPHIEILRPKN